MTEEASVSGAVSVVAVGTKRRSIDGHSGKTAFEVWDILVSSERKELNTDVHV